MVVFTGLLGATPNEDALASVLGHEVGHVVANHAGEKLSKVPPPLTVVVGVCCDRLPGILSNVFFFFFNLS